MSDFTPALLELECPYPEFGMGLSAPSARDYLVLMPWLGQVDAATGDTCVGLQMAIDDGQSVAELAEALGASASTTYRLLAKNKAWLQRMAMLDARLVQAREDGEDRLDWRLSDLVVDTPLRDQLLVLTTAARRDLSLRELRDLWPVRRLRRDATFTARNLGALARSIELLGLGAEFEELRDEARTRLERRHRDKGLRRASMATHGAEPEIDATSQAFAFEFIESTAALRRQLAARREPDWSCPAK